MKAIKQILEQEADIQQPDTSADEMPPDVPSIKAQDDEKEAKNASIKSFISEASVRIRAVITRVAGAEGFVNGDQIADAILNDMSEIIKKNAQKLE